MKTFNFMCLLSVVATVGISVPVISIAEEAATEYSTSQHDFSRTRQVNDSYQFSDNQKETGAITDIPNVDEHQSQHDLSKTHAASSQYDFANNPEPSALLVSENLVPFKQSQHDKSMSDF